MHWRYREKQNDQEHYEKASFFSDSWVLGWFFCFAFEKMSSSLHMLLAMLFIHVGIRSNSRSRMFFKTGVLKNFAISTGEHLCWSLFLIKLQDWRLAFSLKRDSTIWMNFAKIFKNSLFIEQKFTILFRNLM